jgi:hypothetical protein
VITIRDAVLRAFNAAEIGAVFIEEYAFGQQRAGSSSVTGLAELGGAVKTAIFEQHGMIYVPVVRGTALSSLFGKGWGRGKTKEQVLRRLAEAGHEFDDHDVADAFLVNLYGHLKHMRGVIQ